MFIFVKFAQFLNNSQFGSVQLVDTLTKSVKIQKSKTGWPSSAVHANCEENKENVTFFILSSIFKTER